MAFTARARAELPLAMLSVLRTAEADTIALPEIVRDGEMLRPVGRKWLPSWIDDRHGGLWCRGEYSLLVSGEVGE